VSFNAFKNLKNEIMQTFLNVDVARIFFMKQNIRLEEQYGFIPENTHFAEGGCSAEINERDYLMTEQYWGECFKFGGLAGYCHAGKTGLEAVSHHVPEVSGIKNLLFLNGFLTGHSFCFCPTMTHDLLFCRHGFSKSGSLISVPMSRSSRTWLRSTRIS